MIKGLYKITKANGLFYIYRKEKFLFWSYWSLLEFPWMIRSLASAEENIIEYEERHNFVPEPEKIVKYVGNKHEL